VDVSAFHQAWRALEDTHEFFGLLTRFSISRIAALRLAQAEFVQSLHVDQIEALLQRASEQKMPVMVFVANRGMLQIFSGRVDRVVVQDKWINILDERFNLHLLQESVRTLWLVKKPTQYGYVTSIEAFDQQGELVITFFGERELDSPELQSWRDLTESLAVEAESCVH
jgi:putative hemin transport protein